MLPSDVFISAFRHTLQIAPEEELTLRTSEIYALWTSALASKSSPIWSAISCRYGGSGSGAGAEVSAGCGSNGETVSVKLPIEQAGMSTNMPTIGNLTPKKLARYRMRNEISFNQAAPACAQALCTGSDFVFVCNLAGRIVAIWHWNHCLLSGLTCNGWS
jgi:hypothetical protein